MRIWMMMLAKLPKSRTLRRIDHAYPHMHYLIGSKKNLYLRSDKSIKFYERPTHQSDLFKFLLFQKKSFKIHLQLMNVILQIDTLTKSIQHIHLQLPCQTHLHKAM
jgi:hypothetical protein